MSETKKILTIITVVFNDRTIGKTIQSVIPHLSAEVEYIVIDGGSTDGTLDIINTYKDHIDILVSEPDNGIYDAINKGITLAKGNFIFHLNSGDFLKNIPLHDLKFAENSVAAISYPLFIDSRIYYPYFNWKIKYKSTIQHQGTFYRRNILNYNSSYKIFSDYNYNQKLYKDKKIVLIKKTPIISTHLSGGVSSNGSKRNELYLVIANNFGIFYVLLSIIDSLINKIKRTINN